MNATATFDIGTILLSVAGFLFVMLLGIVGFGIKGALSRLEKSIDMIVAKLETTMTTTRCGEHHLAHQKQHELENDGHKETHARFEASINGIGRKLQKHIDDTIRVDG